MEVVSTSPDTGQQGGCAPARNRDVHALAGKPGRASVPLFIMKNSSSYARPAGLVLAAAFLSLTAQAQTVALLGETVITANRTAQPLSDLVADVSVLDREDIERSGAGTLPDILARVPGIEMGRNGGPGTTTSLFVRGGETRYTAVFIDGVRVDTQSGSGGAPWENIPLALIDRIEVLRGAAGAVYGADAMSGVIQIFTRKGEGGFSPFVSTGVGTYGTRKTEAGFSGSHGGFDYALGLGDESSKGFNARPVAGQNGDDDGYNRQSANVRLGWQITPNQRVEATGLSSNMNASYDTSAKDDKSIYQLQTMGLNWLAQWSGAYSTRLSATEARNRYETEPSFSKSITRQRGYLFQNEYRVGPQLFTAALERREDQLDNSTTTPATSARALNGFALGYGFSGKQHTLQLQARQDQDSEFGLQSTGSVAYGYALTPQWRLTASAGTAFRAPTLYQRFSIYGVSTLQPENSRNLEMGARYSEGSTSWGVVAYRNMVNNLIVYANSNPGCPNSPNGCYGSVAQAEYKGVTFSGNQRLQDVNLRASLDIQDPRDGITGLMLARRSNQHATLGADTRQGRWIYGVESQLSGMRYDTAANTTVLPGYALYNLHARTQLARDWSMLLRLDNVTDTQYQLANTYATAGRSLFVSLTWAPGPAPAQ
jgi:vitamin B12 transporter